MYSVSEFASDLGFVEGPVVRQTGGITVVSLSLGRLFHVDDDGTTVLAETGNAPNGCAEGVDGSLFIAQNGGHCPGLERRTSPGGIELLRPDGSRQWITQDPVAPNDLCFGPDNLLYVTDPTRQAVRDDGRIWRVDPATREAELLCSVPWFPNGIAFGPTDDALFVASTAERRVYRYDVGSAGLGEPSVFVRQQSGHPDGIAFDADGNLLIASVGEPGTHGTVEVWDPAGRHLESVSLGNSRYLTNLALDPSGALYVTDSDKGVIHLITDWPTRGLQLHPFRDEEKKDR